VGVSESRNNPSKGEVERLLDWLLLLALDPLMWPVLLVSGLLSGALFLAPLWLTYRSGSHVALASVVALYVVVLLLLSRSFSRGRFGILGWCVLSAWAVCLVVGLFVTYP
jgi:hypothetical protein